MNFMWIWVLASAYVIDVGSNAISYGSDQYLSFWRLIRLDFDALAMGRIIVMLARLLTFGDEILLRLVDQLALEAGANDASA